MSATIGEHGQGQRRHTGVIHDGFTLERSYPVEAARVFGAFASWEAKNVWGDTGDIEEAAGDAGIVEFDFRPGGRERFGHVRDGVTYRYIGLYYDIVPDRRIVYSYEMYAGETRISVSLATIEFVEQDGLTRLTVTEQGAYLDGIDGPEANELRREGLAAMIDQLTGYLAAQPNR